MADLAEPLEFLPDASFDLVTASLVLHYLRDWGPPLRELRRVLRPGGALLISTHHPVQDVEIADPPAPYFETTLLTDTWRKAGRDFQVRFYHRPLSAIGDALADAGFLIERIAEPIPDREAFADDPALYQRMMRCPLFLFIRAITQRAPTTDRHTARMTRAARFHCPADSITDRASGRCPPQSGYSSFRQERGSAG